MASWVTLARAVAQSLVAASGSHVSSAALAVSPGAATAAPMRGLRSSPVSPSLFFSGSLSVKSIPAAKGVSSRAQSSGRVVASTNGTGAPSGLAIDLRGNCLSFVFYFSISEACSSESIDGSPTSEAFCSTGLDTRKCIDLLGRVTKLWVVFA